MLAARPRVSLSVFCCCVVAGAAQGATDSPSLLPPMPPSPVADFRQLLEADPAATAAALRDKPEPLRRFLEVKLREYRALAPGERELRLRATELQWYLRPLLVAPAEERSPRLAQIPEGYRAELWDRLRQWDALSASARTDLLTYESTLAWLARTASQTPDLQEGARAGLSPEARQRLDAELARWQALPLERRQNMCDLFQRFFELSTRQQEKTLDQLSETERRQMEATLRAFERLDPAARRSCLESFRKFASLSPAERAEFLKSAERWREMTPAEREGWRRLVARVPPMPPMFGQPPLPPGAARSAAAPAGVPSLGTNRLR